MKALVTSKCCHLADELTNFTANRQTNKQNIAITYCPGICEQGLNNFKDLTKSLKNKKD